MERYSWWNVNFSSLVSKNDDEMISQPNGFGFGLGNLTVVSDKGEDTGPSSTTSPVYTLALGYTVLLLGSYAYSSTVPRNSNSRKLLVFFYSVVKVCGLLALEIVGCPLVTGWWLDICTIDVGATSLASRLAFAIQAPWTAMFLHWLGGILFMHNFSGAVGLLREVMRPGALWFFRDPDDPDFHPVKQMLEKPLAVYCRRLLMISILYGLVIFLVAWVPIHFALLLIPSLLPFNLTLTHPVEFLCLSFAIPVLPDLIGNVSASKDLVKAWLGAGGKATGISAYLLPPPDSTWPRDRRCGVCHKSCQAEGGAVLCRFCGIDAYCSTKCADIALSTGGHGPTCYRKTWFTTRVAAFLLLATVWLVGVVTFTFTVPILIGRDLLGLVFNSQVHEIYSLSTGVAALFVAMQAGYGLGHVLCSGLTGLTTAIPKMVRLAIRLSAAFIAAAILLGWLPLLVGLVTDFAIIMPLKCLAADLSPTVSLWQDWGVGVMLLRMGHQAWAEAGPGPRPILYEVLESIRDAGLDGVNVLQVVIAVTPPSVTLLTLLAVPYAAVYKMLPFLGLRIGFALAAVRWLYPVVMGLSALVICVQKAGMQLRVLFRKVRDNKYLVGRRLVNIDGQLVE